MMKKIYFDLDGTLAGLYEVEGWLNYILDEDATPYEIAKPLLNLSALARQLNRLQKIGFEIGIISWLAKDATEEYDREVELTKREWLAKHLPSVHWNEIHIVKYGTPKHTLGNGILFDDEERNRVAWGNGAFDVENILEILKSVA